MKKTSKLVILALLVVGAIMTLCACGLVENAQSIEIVNPPKQDYVTTDEDFDWTGFQIKVTRNDGSFEYLTYAQLESAANFTVSAFDNSAGKHTAIITYMGVSVAFEYTVNAGLFAGGDGTEANPYQIATAEQFYRLAGDQKGNYFELINDIDFNGTLKENGEINASNFTFNGNGYALEGVDYAIFNAFGAVGTKTVFTNVDLHMQELGIIAWYFYGEYVEISDVNVYGIRERSGVDQNEGFIVAHTYAEETLLSDISIYADLITYDAYASPFIGGYAQIPTGASFTSMSVKFDGCNFYGTAQAQRLGLFMGNGYSGSSVASEKVSVSVTNSKNYGTLIAAKVTYFGKVGELNIQDTDDATVVSEAFGSSVPGFGVTKSFNAMTITTTNGFKFNAVDNAAEYKVFVYVWGKVYTDAECTNSTGTNTATVYSNTVSKDNLNDFNLAFGKWTLEANAEIDTVNCKASTLTNVGYMEGKEYPATYVVFALDAQDNVIGFGVKVA